MGIGLEERRTANYYWGFNISGAERLSSACVAFNKKQQEFEGTGLRKSTLRIDRAY